MTKTKKQREREELEAWRQTMLCPLAGKVICGCGARFEDFDDECSVDLDVICDGFVRIELALYPDGRTLEGIAAPEQIERCRKPVEAA